MFKKIVDRKGNEFFPVKDNLDAIQEELGIIIPKELKEFYLEVGYGFLASTEYRFNRIMDPESLRDFRLRDGDFKDNNELDIYESQEKDKIIFFELSEDYFLSIGFTGKNKGKIFDGEIEIADSLEEFLIKYQKNEHYFE